MSVLVTMQVGPVDPTKVRAAEESLAAEPAPGRFSHALYFREGDPTQMLIVDEWESHHMMMAFTDRVGDEYNHLAGTEGLDWITGVWELPE